MGTHITDAQVDAAAHRMRKIIEAAENSNQAGEDALIKANAAPDLYEALEAVRRVLSGGTYYTRTVGEGEGAKDQSDWLFSLDQIDRLSVDIERALSKATGDK